MQLINNSPARYFKVSSLLVLIKNERLWNESIVLTRCCRCDVICLPSQGKCVMSCHFAHRELLLTANGRLLLKYLTSQSVTFTICMQHFNTQKCYFLFIESRGGAVGWGTVLQAGMSRVRFPMGSLEFFIDLIHTTISCSRKELCL